MTRRSGELSDLAPARGKEIILYFEDDKYLEVVFSVGGCVSGYVSGYIGFPYVVMFLPQYVWGKGGIHSVCLKICFETFDMY